MKAKLKSCTGSSLIEMLCVIGISVLIGAAILVGMDFAAGFYRSTVSMSEAKYLSSTLTIAVTDELRYAGSFKVDTDGKLTEFFSQNYGKLNGGFTSTDGRIVLGSGSEAYELLSEAAYTNGSSADIEVHYDNDKGLFKVRLTVTGGINTIENQFEVKPLNAAPE